MHRVGRMARRCAAASRTARSLTSPSRSRHSWRWRKGCGNRAFRRRRSFTPISNRGCSCSRIWVRSAWSPATIAERYEAVVDVLLALHDRRLPDALPVAPHVEYKIPSYDIGAFLIEAELLLDWYLPRLGAPVTEEARAAFQALWLAQRSELKRVGLLDFQDALMGPAAYDLASLLQDARVDVPEQLEVALLGRYVRGRRQGDPEFDPA